MMIHALLTVVAAAVIAPSAHARTLDRNYRPSDEAAARFEFLRRRKRERDGYITQDGDRNEEHLRRAPEGHPSWEEQEKRRADVFDKRFGAGAYDGIIRFSGDCRTLWEGSTKACDYTATADLIEGAYRFVALESAVEKKEVDRDSKEFRERDRAHRAALLKAIELFRPKKESSKEYSRSFAAFSEPILKELSPERRP